MSNIPWQNVPDLAGMRQQALREQAATRRTRRELRQARRAERRARRAARSEVEGVRKPTPGATTWSLQD